MRSDSYLRFIGTAHSGANWYAKLSDDLPLAGNQFSVTSIQMMLKTQSSWHKIIFSAPYNHSMNASLSRHTIKLSLSVEFVTIASASGLNITRANPCSTFDLPEAAAAVKSGESCTESRTRCIGVHTDCTEAPPMHGLRFKPCHRLYFCGFCASILFQIFLKEKISTKIITQFQYYSYRHKTCFSV